MYKVSFLIPVYNAKGTNVETTIINGNILMESRKIKKVEKHNKDKK